VGTSSGVTFGVITELNTGWRTILCAVILLSHAFARLKVQEIASRAVPESIAHGGSIQGVFFLWKKVTRAPGQGEAIQELLGPGGQP
jgi:hypothetical protein